MLDQELRRSLPARIAAIGFILVIIFGNLWLALALIASRAPDWISVGFAVGIATALTGGVGLAWLRLRQLLRGGPGTGPGPDAPS